MKFLAYKIIKYAYQAFIIENLDVVTLKLDMKVYEFWKQYSNLTNYAQFANFQTTRHTKILAIH